MIHAYPPCDHDECPPSHCLRREKGKEHEVTTQRPAPADRGMTAGAGQTVHELLREIVRAHSDPADPNYNECDKAMCKWCEDAKKILALDVVVLKKHD